MAPCFAATILLGSFCREECPLAARTPCDDKRIDLHFWQAFGVVVAPKCIDHCPQDQLQKDLKQKIHR